MDFASFLKKEWKVLLLILCLIVGIVYLNSISKRLTSLEHQNSKIISTFDSIESVTINTDGNLNAVSKQVDKIDSNVAFIIKKIRRR